MFGQSPRNRLGCARKPLAVDRLCAGIRWQRRNDPCPFYPLQKGADRNFFMAPKSNNASSSIEFVL
jgi:hypothetical protein